MTDFDIQKVKKGLSDDIQKIREARISFEEKTGAILKKIDADISADPDVLFPEDKEDVAVEQSLEDFDKSLDDALLKLAKKNDETGE